MWEVDLEASLGLHVHIDLNKSSKMDQPKSPIKASVFICLFKL